MTQPLKVNNTPISQIKNLCNIIRRFFDEETIIILAVFIMLAIAMTIKSGFILSSDGPNYFAYLRSIFFDLDLDFRNEYFNFNKAFWDTYRPKFTETGHYTNVFSVGPAILWAPFYTAAHLFVLWSGHLGYQYSPDGFSTPYVYSINFASVFYGFLGTVFIFKACTKYFSRSISLISALTVMLSTFILYYIVNQPYMSHSLSFFSASLFIYYWDVTRFKRKSYQWMVLGFFAGMMMLVRWQNGLLMILPALESLVYYYENISRRNWPSCVSMLKNNALFLLLAAVGFFPQMLAWKIIYGGFLTIPQGNGFLRWSTPFIMEVLFSSRHGLLSWSPIIYLSFAGWLLFFKRDKFMFWSSLTAFLLILYVNSIVLDWWAGWGFGMRRFDGVILLFGLGFAAICSELEKARLHFSFPLTIIILSFFMGLNFHLINLADSQIHPGGPVDFEKYKLTGYPFTFPANAVFALKFGEPMSRYDTLVGGYIDDPAFYGNTISMKEPSPLLGAGWSRPEESEGVSFRDMEEFSVIYAPVLSVTNFNMIFRVKALPQLKKPLVIYLNDAKIGSIYFISDWYDYSVTLPKRLLKPGINVLKFYNFSGVTASFESISFYSLEPAASWK